MENKNNYTFPLEELLASIKASGYEVSIQQILDIQTILLTTPVSRLKPDRLKLLITPVIAKNDEEQRHIYRIIDSYVAEKTKTAIPPVNAFAQWRYEHKKMVFALKIAGFIAVVITGILFYIASHRKAAISTTPKRVAAIKRDSLPTAQPQATLPENQPASIATPEKPTNTIDITVLGSGQSIIPVAIDLNVQMAATFGTLMGVILAWVIFYERKKKMEMKERQRANDAIFVKRTENKKRPTNSGFEPDGELAQPTIQFAEKDYLVHLPRALQKIKSHLKKPAVVQNPGLDIKGSINKSVRSAGFTSLVYSSEWKDRKYLILIENRYNEAHINYLLNYLVNIVSAAVNTVARYSYTGDAGMLRDENGNWVSLKDLAYQYKGYHLIVIGKGPALNDIFQSWTSRAIVTPTPLPDWSYHEEQLQKSKFQVVPADIEGIELLAKAIGEDTFISRNQLLKQLTNLYSVEQNDFQSVAGLQQYLNDERLFQMVCSLAVYPRLQWALTLALFDAQLKNNAAHGSTGELSYELLLKVARIPWLYEDRLEDTIRLDLLNSLTAETELIARETILALLDEARINIVHDSPAFTELNTQYNINAFFLFSHDQYKYRTYAGSKEVINDYWKNLTEWALKEHVDKSGSVLMPRYKSGQSSVQEFLLKEKQFEKWNINFLKVTLLTLPAILLYIIFAIFKPAFVYPPELYKNVSLVAVIKKESNCRQRLNYVINSTNGKSDTILLNSSKATDTIPFKDAKYNEVISLELWAKDNGMKPVSFAATDSLFEVSAKCW